MAILNATIVNFKAVERALLGAFEDWATEDINDAYWDDQFLDMGLWPYNNETKRSNGEVVDSPRDIYDLGDLYRSGKESYVVTIAPQQATASWQWLDYGYYVHYGTGSNVTARPFTDDIALVASFFRRAPGKAFVRRVQTALDRINAPNRLPS